MLTSNLKKKIKYNTKCFLCGELVNPVQDLEYIKNKRGLEYFVHTKCIRKEYKKGFK